MSMTNVLAGLSQFVGLCVPNQCANYLQTPQVAQNITQTLNEFYSNASKKQNATVVKNVVLFNPVTTNPKMGGGSIATVTIILALFAF